MERAILKKIVSRQVLVDSAETFPVKVHLVPGHFLAKVVQGEELLKEKLIQLGFERHNASICHTT